MSSSQANTVGSQFTLSYVRVRDIILERCLVVNSHANMGISDPAGYPTTQTRRSVLPLVLRRYRKCNRGACPCAGRQSTACTAVRTILQRTSKMK